MSVLENLMRLRQRRVRLAKRDVGPTQRQTWIPLQGGYICSHVGRAGPSTGALLICSGLSRRAQHLANSFLYLAKANQIFVAGHKGSPEDGLKAVKARVLLVPRRPICSSSQSTPARPWRSSARRASTSRSPPTVATSTV